jgi:DNA-binding NtrC family response regulator
MLGSYEKKRVLIVDDEKIITDTLVMIFSNEGYDARGVYSAEQALSLMSEWIPQLAIIDVRLPEMNGIDLAILFKAEYPDCRLSLFSGETATGDLLDNALREGHSFSVLAKPVHPTELLGLASRLLFPLEEFRCDIA